MGRLLFFNVIGVGKTGVLTLETIQKTLKPQITLSSTQILRPYGSFGFREIVPGSGYYSARRFDALLNEIGNPIETIYAKDAYRLVMRENPLHHPVLNANVPAFILSLIPQSTFEELRRALLDQAGGGDGN